MNKSWWQQFEGRTIENKYVLQRLLGVGGFGGVFQADHVVEDTFVRHVAVKLIVSDEDEMQRQLGELVAASTLRHASLLTCFDVGATTFENLKLLYLVMELAEGGLQAHLATGHLFSPPDALKLTKSLTEGLAYLHEQKRVHRDVKPSNVLQVEGQWKLSDFGAIRESSETISHTGLILGTIEYMPPESFDGVVSPAWDTWSLGVLVLRALTGRSAYPEMSGQQLMRAILDKQPDIPLNLPAPFGDIIRGCLVKDYRERCSAQHIAAMIQRAGMTTSVEAPSDEVTIASPTPARARFLQRRRRLTPILPVSAALILAAVGVWWFVTHGRAVGTAPARPPDRVAIPSSKPYDYSVAPLEAPCGPAPRVTILNLNGSAQITGADVRTVRVTAHKFIQSLPKADADRANNDTPLQLTCRSEEVTIRTNQERLMDHSGIATDLEITVPNAASIQARGGQGDVTIVNLGGSLDVDKDKAAVQLRNVEGDVRVKVRESPLIHAAAVRGSIELKVGPAIAFTAEQAPGEIDYKPGQLSGSNIVGPVNIDAKSTSVRLLGFTERLEAKLTGTGDVILRTGGPEPPETMVSMESGNIDLTLPPGARFDLKLITESGRAENNYGPELKAGDDGRIAAITGGQGGSQLRLTTERGQVTVRKSTD